MDFNVPAGDNSSGAFRVVMVVEFSTKAERPQAVIRWTIEIMCLVTALGAFSIKVASLALMSIDSNWWGRVISSLMPITVLVIGATMLANQEPGCQLIPGLK